MTLGGFVRDLWLSVAGAYLALAALDLGSQWWRHQKSLRMTHEEVRQENRESEGDPQIIRHRRMRLNPANDRAKH